MILIVSIFSLILVFKLIILFGFLFKFKKTPIIKEDELPTVSVLIPARNEAENLPACLDSLLQLDYPVDKLEILIGDDQSTDLTATIVKAYEQQYEHLHLHGIEPDYHDLVARSNVLAQLVQKSHHDKLVFLDADMQVDSCWLREMVAPTVHGYRVVSGYTEVEAKSWLAQLQKFDWVNVIMLLKVGADIYKPGTALGNNMLVNRKAYKSVGGYEQIGPTFTEDNDLTLAMVKKGFLLFQLVVPGGARTLPMSGWKDLYEQRNRWMQGAFKQPFVRLIPLLLARIFVLLAAITFFLDPQSAIGMLILFSWIDIVSSWSMSRKIKKFIPFHIVLLAPVFNSLLDTFTLLSYPWNRKVTWKGRKL